MEFFIVYLVTILSKVAVLAGICLALALIAFVIASIIYGVIYGDGEDTTAVRTTWKNIIKVIVVSAFLVVFIPGRNQIVWIAGGGLALMAVQNEEVQELPENIVKAVNSFLETFVEVEDE